MAVLSLPLPQLYFPHTLGCNVWHSKYKIMLEEQKMQYSPQLAQMMRHDCWAEGTLSRAVGTLIGEVRYIEFGHRRNWWRLLRKQGAWLETAGKDFSCEENSAKKKKKHKYESKCNKKCCKTLCPTLNTLSEILQSGSEGKNSFQKHCN